ncbi:hypothetical protein Pint_36168 [Pistacia integerrima]|uniref:Uncharacterized protein n=1 Tax=Pistacia integerrima TaxID=434235 RepID=A0ACC0Y0Y1_9ROSI|nr:hypothetical protein Pint_36168 [Pistacia integerrima]
MLELGPAFAVDKILAPACFNSGFISCSYLRLHYKKAHYIWICRGMELIKRLAVSRLIKMIHDRPIHDVKILETSVKD